MLQLKGTATISENGFHFNSGMPIHQPLLDRAMKLLGTLHITRNGCVDFVGRRRVTLPPLLTRICEGANFHLKRSSQHYILQIKLPIVEHRNDTAATLSHTVSVVMNEITLDRRELLESNL